MGNPVGAAHDDPWNEAGTDIVGTARPVTRTENVTQSGTLAVSGTTVLSGATTISGATVLSGATVRSAPPAAQAITANDTEITLPTGGFTKEVTNDGSYTGIIIAAGSVDGQLLCIFNSTATNTLTMATAATSNVANGTSCVLRALEAALFIWDSGASRWFALGGSV